MLKGFLLNTGITAAAIDYIRAMQRAGRKVVGPEDPQLRTLKVLREERS